MVAFEPERVIVRVESCVFVQLRRVYAEVNENRPAEYWDYDNLAITWGYVAVDCRPPVVGLHFARS